MHREFNLQDYRVKSVDTTNVGFARDFVETPYNECDIVSRIVEQSYVVVQPKPTNLVFDICSDIITDIHVTDETNTAIPYMLMFRDQSLPETTKSVFPGLTPLAFTRFGIVIDLSNFPRGSRVRLSYTSLLVRNDIKEECMRRRLIFDGVGYENMRVTTFDETWNGEIVGDYTHDLSNVVSDDDYVNFRAYFANIQKTVVPRLTELGVKADLLTRGKHLCVKQHRADTFNIECDMILIKESYENGNHEYFVDIPIRRESDIKDSFEVTSDAPLTAKVIVTTPQRTQEFSLENFVCIPVTSPYLDFVLRVTWNPSDELHTFTVHSETYLLNLDERDNLTYPLVVDGIRNTDGDQVRVKYDCGTIRSVKV